MASHQHTVDDAFIVAHRRDCSLRDGTSIRLRPVAADDKERLQAGFERLSPDSRYRRFLAPTGVLTERMLRYFTEIDYDDHFAWAALSLDEPDEPGIAVARYVRDRPGSDVAEPAVAVIDDYQGRGLGSLLLRLLTASAVANGVKRFRATLMRDNRPMYNLFAEAGGTFVTETAGLLRAEVELPTCELARAELLDSLLRHSCDGAADAARRVLTGVD